MPLLGIGLPLSKKPRDPIPCCVPLISVFSCVRCMVVVAWYMQTMVMTHTGASGFNHLKLVAASKGTATPNKFNKNIISILQLQITVPLLVKIALHPPEFPS